jgi:hypothetical protein
MSFKKDLLSRLRNTALTFLDGELITVVEHIQRPRLSKAQKEEANDILTRAEINARERRRKTPMPSLEVNALQKRFVLVQHQQTPIETFRGTYP